MHMTAYKRSSSINGYRGLHTLVGKREPGVKASMGRTNGFLKEQIKKFVIMLVHADETGLSVFFQGHKTPLEREFIVSLLLVFFLRVKATQKREFMAALFSRSFYVSQIKEAPKRFLSASVESQMSSVKNNLHTNSDSKWVPTSASVF